MKKMSNFSMIKMTSFLFLFMPLLGISQNFKNLVDSVVKYKDSLNLPEILQFFDEGIAGVKQRLLVKAQLAALNIGTRKINFALQPASAFSTSSGNFYVVVEQQDGENPVCDQLTIGNLSEDELQVSDDGKILFSCQTNMGRTAFLNQYAVAYRGMKVGSLSYIYNYGKVLLSKDGHYGFIAMLTDGPFNRPTSEALIIDGSIVLFSGEKIGKYQVIEIPMNYQFIIGPGGGYMVNMGIRSLSGDHLARFIAYRQGNASYTKPMPCPPVTHCETNSSGQQVFSDGGMLMTKSNESLPSDAHKFVINEQGKIFTSNMQLFGYEIAHPEKYSSNHDPRFLSENDKYVFNFPSEAMFGYTPPITKNGAPDFRNNITGDLFHSIAISDNNTVGFYFSCIVNGVRKKAIVMGRAKNDDHVPIAGPIKNLK